MKLRLFLGTCETNIHSITLIDTWHPSEVLWEGPFSEVADYLIPNGLMDATIISWSFYSDNVLRIEINTVV